MPRDLLPHRQCMDKRGIVWYSLCVQSLPNEMTQFFGQILQQKIEPPIHPQIVTNYLRNMMECKELDEIELDDEDWMSLREHVETLSQTAGLLSYRLDSMQDALEQETFQLATHTIRVARTKSYEHVQAFLQELSLTEETLTVGRFLRALNRYLIQENCIDLNDLQIRLNPRLCAVFSKPPGLKKVPYALLLKNLPNLFE